MRQGKRNTWQKCALVRAASVAFICAAIAAVGPAAQAQTPSPLRSAALEVIERQIASAFPDVNHMTPERLNLLLREAPGRVKLLDVREPEEFEVSRLIGAHRVDPNARGTAGIVAEVGSLKGQIVVVYCSVGLRSSRLLVRIGQGLREKGAAELHNLSGGVFRWRNEGRPLESSDGPTRAVHPNNPLWRQFLLDDPGLVVATK